jgi:hypothetical protein
LKISGDPDDRIDRCGRGGDAQRRSNSRLQIEMLRINPDRGETGKYAAGAAADGSGTDSLEPNSQMGHHRVPATVHVGFAAISIVSNLRENSLVRIKNRNSFIAGLVLVILYSLAYLSGRAFVEKYRNVILAVLLILALFCFIDAFTAPSPRDQ